MKSKRTAFRIADYIADLELQFPDLVDQLPWEIVPAIGVLIEKKIKSLNSDYRKKGNIAIHKTAIVEDHATLKSPLIISPNCFVAAHAYLRNGVFLGSGVSLGPGCEVKSSLIFSSSALAHFNFVGDSLVGSGVNLEAGAVVANHFNERASKQIDVTIGGKRIKTGVEKFGALIGDHSRIGANAVLSPGTVLPSQSIVKRLQLLEQLKRR